MKMILVIMLNNTNKHSRQKPHRISDCGDKSILIVWQEGSRNIPTFMHFVYSVPINTGMQQSNVIAEPQHVVERNLIEGSEYNAFVDRQITSQVYNYVGNIGHI